jgi:Mrp family chromosome partitioning ATPase
MTTLGELLKEPPPASAERAKPSLHIEPPARPELLRRPSIREEQVRSLVEQLFFRHESGPVRRVGFTSIEASTSTAPICLEVARALVDEGTYEVGLIDASIGEPQLPALAQIPIPTRQSTPWVVGPRLWLAPRESWRSEAEANAPTQHNLERLRDLAAEFDFAVVHCPPVSWLTARIANCCDGLVLVLTANRTRRLVAAQVRDRLNRLHIPVLGTVLTDRRFPVPEGLYRSL